MNNLWFKTKIKTGIVAQLLSFLGLKLFLYCSIIAAPSWSLINCPNAYASPLTAASIALFLLVPSSQGIGVNVGTGVAVTFEWGCSGGTVLSIKCSKS
jgi:hypothetical protein